MEDPFSIFIALSAFITVVSFYRWRTHPLYSIPTLGGTSLPGLSYLTALRFLLHGKEIIREGYYRYQNTAFKVATLDQWMVVVSGSKMVEDLRSRPDDEVSFLEGAEETVQMKYTIGREIIEDPYHVDIIKEKLTRTLPVVLPAVIDELKLAVHEHIPTKGDEWLSVNATSVMQQIVARASSRAFVGLPMCRNQKYLDLSIAFTMDVAMDRIKLNFVPYALKPLVGFMISKANKSIKTALGYLQPVLDERRLKMAKSEGDWEDKPNDMLQWLLEEEINRKGDDLDVTRRVLLVNFTAIHTSSTSVIQVLYDLASRPEYLDALRTEIEDIIGIEGWTKAAMAKLWKLDSFMRECQRTNGIETTSLTRKALKDITLRDGTFIPKGTLIVAAAHPMHHDETNYEDASVFDPFRFSRMREQEGQSTKHQYVNTSAEYVPFGHGKHACPGRFFAANELKAVLAYIILNFDMKIDGDGSRPGNLYIGTTVIPSPSGRVLFRRRGGKD